ncbi:hypothetical protein AOLI_G00058590 [Acnodon oligacanthus]
MKAALGRGNERLLRLMNARLPLLYGRSCWRSWSYQSRRGLSVLLEAPSGLRRKGTGQREARLLPTLPKELRSLSHNPFTQPDPPAKQAQSEGEHTAHERPEETRKVT